jgi:hypothetical protein
MWYTNSLPKNIITEEYKKLKYRTEPWNDPETVKQWTNTYGNIFSAGQTADYKTYQPCWVNDIIEILKFDTAGSSFYKMSPGNIIPYHSDSYKRYIKYHNIKNVNKIVRVVVFLEDWQRGHIFEVDGTPLYNYKSGDYVLWNYNTPHLAANLGNTNRYTLQLTGII